jgi:hypothetical protein
MAQRFFDLEYRLKTDTAFANQCQKRMDLVADSLARANKDPRYKKEAQARTFDVLRLTGYNPIVFSKYLVPVMFEGKPLDFKEYPLAYYLTPIIPELDLTIMGSRQISKSSTIAFRFLAIGHLMRSYVGYYIVPHPEHLKTFARRFDDMYQGFRFKMTTAKHGEASNLYYKKFRKGSNFSLFHVLEDDTKARGKTGDELVFDEYQNFDVDFHETIDEILAASHWRVKIKTGTSLHTDTALNYSFERSSMGYWHIFCPKCNHENIPLKEEGVLDMIQPEGPCCIKCGTLLNPSTGLYVHRYPDRINRQNPRIGIHVPQLFTPAVLNNKARWRAMYDKKVSGGSVDRFLQENVGLPTEQGLREVTEKDLQQMCREDNGDARQGCGYYQKLALSRKHYRFILSGCDWGGSDHNRASRTKVSTTVHAMAGMLPNGNLDLIHFRRYEHMDYAGIIDDITTMHKKLNGYAIATDFGVGYYYNTQLRLKIPESKHLIFQYTGPRSKVIARPPATEMRNHFVVNKTETISMLYEALKNGMLKSFRWEEASPFLNDFLQVYRNVVESTIGLSTFTWASNPSKPNDALQACNYILILSKILRGEAIFEDPQLELEVRRSLLSGGQISPGGKDGGAYSG